MNLLCRLGLHQKRLVKHFWSMNYEENTYSLNYYGKECILCKTRFIEQGPSGWMLLDTMKEAETWVNEKKKKLKPNHLSLIKKD